MYCLNKIVVSFVNIYLRPERANFGLISSKDWYMMTKMKTKYILMTFIQKTVLNKFKKCKLE